MVGELIGRLLVGENSGEVIERDEGEEEEELSVESFPQVLLSRKFPLAINIHS